MCKETKIFFTLLVASTLFIVSGFVRMDHSGLSLILLGISVFIGIYVPIANFDFEKISNRDTYRYEPMPRKERKEIVVRHTHEHYNYNFTSLTEGREITRTLEDGTSVSLKHVRKWK